MSKGSSPRPFSVSAEDYSAKWEAIFSKGKSNVGFIQEKTDNPASEDQVLTDKEGRRDCCGDSPIPSDNKPTQ